MFISVDLPAPFSPRRTWTSPGSRVRSMWSLARTPGKRLVMPLSSSRIGLVPVEPAEAPAGDFTARPPISPLRGCVRCPSLRIDRDGPSDDAGLDRVDLALERSGDLAVKLVVGSQAHATVSQCPLVGTTREGAAGGRFDRRLDGDRYALVD